jgi:protein gp37
MENLEKGLPPTKAGPYHGLAEMTPAGPRWTGKIRTVPEHLEDPLRWKKPRMVFVNSMSDLFHENLDDVEIEKILLVMMQAKQHTFQVLTKRADRMQKFLSSFYTPKAGGWPLPNVWWGVSVEDQAAADKRIPLLLKTPAAVRWISAEPLLGPLDIKNYFHNPLGESLGLIGPTVDWVVVGGESGAGARHMAIEWARTIRDQCASANTKFFMKQLGGDSDKKGTVEDFPEDLRIREYPKT